MRIIIISPFDVIPEDEVRPGRIWNYVNQAGFYANEIVWITSRYSHYHKRYRNKNKIPNDNYIPNTNIIKIDVIKYSDNVSFKRLLNHAQFGVMVYKKLKQLISKWKPDVILCAMPPLLTPFSLSQLFIT